MRPIGPVTTWLVGDLRPRMRYLQVVKASPLHVAPDTQLFLSSFFTPVTHTINLLTPIAGSEFHTFPRLPSEIQTMIWESACAVERIVPILSGLGHLSPITHQTLRVPPVLHACANSRQVGLQHYNLSFHPHLYINREYDHLMLHIFFPFQVIGSDLYRQLEAGLNWEAAPRWLAVFLDDISFCQSEYEPPEPGSSLLRGPTSGPSFHPFSEEFMWSIASYPGPDFNHPVPISELLPWPSSRR